MGEVYRAEHISLGKEVALKILGAELLGDRELRFGREARTTAKLDHPNCVRLFDSGGADGLQFIAMELVDGINLYQALCKDGPMPVDRAVRIVRDILRGLAHAHGLGVLHRDIKPENVMLTPSGRCVVIDVGLARLRDDGPLTATGTCMGSPSYLAPERLLARDYDARADLYSVGVVLYELLAGVKPFTGTTPKEMLRQALERPPRPIRALRKDVPRLLEAVLMRALAKDPDRRFPDAEAMLGALDELPELEQLMVASEQAARDEEAPTTALETLAPVRPSLLRRMWSWLRYGGWRWHHSGSW